MRKAGFAATVAAVLVAASASGGSYFPPPPDYAPTWSPDSSVVVYYRGNDGLHVVDPDGSRDRRLAGLPNSPEYVFSRDWHWIAFVVYDAPGHGAVQVMRPDASDLRVVADGALVNSTPSFSPDGTRIAYAADDGIWTVGVDGSAHRRVAVFGVQPRWSPRADQIAFQSYANNHLYVVPAEGGTPTDITRALGLEATGVAAWSPNGTKLAFVVGAPQGPKVGVYELEGGRVVYFDGASGTRLAWSPSGDAVYASGAGVASDALVRLNLVTGNVSVVVAHGFDVDVAPNGALAYAWTGECGDRQGIYVASRRVTNDCHVYGTAGRDTLRSSPYLYEIVDGRGGDDTLIGIGAAYVGDALVGGEGNDVLRGGFWPERLNGGSGNDTIRGGPNHDTIVGGAGRDRLFGDGGRDTILARDGARDLVDCGTSAPHNGRENDDAYVDRLDYVRNCERVLRVR